MKYSDLKVAEMVKEMANGKEYRIPLEMTGLSFATFADYALSAAEIFNFIYEADRRLSCRQCGGVAVVDISSPTNAIWEH